LEDEIHAIVNPASGAGRTRLRWPRLARRIEALGARVYSYFTQGPGDATRIARCLLERGVRELLSVGGDGTANEVANGFFSDGEALRADAILSVMPTGTGHDFARSLGIRSVAQAVETLRNGVVTRIDLGLASYRGAGGRETRCFVNAADVGLGAATAAAINRSRKILGGLLTYLLGAVRGIVLFEPDLAQVTVDGGRVSEGPTHMVLIANGRFHAGGMRMAPGARMSDGLLEVLVLEQVSRLALVATILPRAYAGTHVTHRAIRQQRGREVEVRAPRALPFEMDGEQPGTTDLRIRILPNALSVRVPPAAVSAPGT